MPKIIDYPRSSLQNSLELARAVDSLGGDCNVETVAEKSGRKIGGAFTALTSGAAKYGLVSTAKGRLSTTELFREYKLAYNASDAEQALKKAFLRVPVFARIFEKFRGNNLPTEIFDKLLIREFGVSDADASRVAGYFLDGAKISGLLKDDKLVASADPLETSSEAASTANDAATGSSQTSVGQGGSIAPTIVRAAVASASTTDLFHIRITGPGMDSVIQINEPDDLSIVEIMLRKVAKQLTAKSEVKKKPSTETVDG